MKKIAILVPRFHPNIAGGAEKLALDYALILKESHQVQIFTTCAKDYVSWKNELREGEEDWDDIKIHRFPVKKERNINVMNQVLESCLRKGNKVSIEEEENFLIEQGPYSPSLVSRVIEVQNQFDLIILVGYLYYPIVKVLPNLKKPTLIIPTFHEEPAFTLPLYKRTFLPDYSYCFNAPEEADVYKKQIGVLPKNYFYIGTYVSLPKEEVLQQNPISVEEEGINLLTLGRIEPAKGFPELYAHYDSWKHFFPKEKIRLVSIGNNHLPNDLIPISVHLQGFVTQTEKENLLQKSHLILNPSALESFSIAIMEAWSFAKPVLVNGKSDVMRGHCQRSQGGLYYSDEISFRRSLEYLIQNPDIRERLGKNGRKYVELNFTKETIKNKLELVVSKLLD
ncbi:glycosyltransferase [Leptospira ilyithenensis]|uniref:Glycosyltransferase n=1 Tax=Leptospira ilyithenensis TaxID=2484901 RepID=A0A4V3JX59_9LEPT|nr:glycosyltransferase family 4 protein [Leptospira ilyithenensis]TGN11217.1 glycosyltransferase [Leptospira ilyithenensis]